MIKRLETTLFTHVENFFSVYFNNILVEGCNFKCIIQERNCEKYSCIYNLFSFYYKNSFT